MEFQPHIILSRSSPRFFYDLQRIIGCKLKLLQYLLRIAARCGKTALLQKRLEIIPSGMLNDAKCTMKHVICFILNHDSLIEKIHINDRAGMLLIHIGHA